MNTDIAQVASVAPSGLTPIHDAIDPVRTPAPSLDFVWGSRVFPMVKLTNRDMSGIPRGMTQTRFVATARIPERAPSAAQPPDAPAGRKTGNHRSAKTGGATGRTRRGSGRS